MENGVVESEKRRGQDLEVCKWYRFLRPCWLFQGTASPGLGHWDACRGSHMLPLLGMSER